MRITIFLQLAGKRGLLKNFNELSNSFLPAPPSSFLPQVFIESIQSANILIFAKTRSASFSGRGLISVL